MTKKAGDLVHHKINVGSIWIPCYFEPTNEQTRQLILCGCDLLLEAAAVY